jgi:CheY-like chemotaxis protein
MDENTKEVVILVVDDEPINVMIAEKILQKKGYKTYSASSGLEAIEKVKTNTPDLILLDVMMPEMDGFEACRILRRDMQFKDIPIIFLTAVTDKESILKGFDVGGNDYLTKPFNSPELAARVKSQVDLKLASDEKMRLINDLKMALDEIKTLSGLLPICSHCKKIRDDTGYWDSVEHYLSKHSDAQFSHGICPDCMRQYYPKVAEKLLNKEEQNS